MRIILLMIYYNGINLLIGYCNAFIHAYPANITNTCNHYAISGQNF